MKLPWLNTPLFAPFDEDEGAGSGVVFNHDDDEDEVIDADEESDDDDSEDDDDDSESESSKGLNIDYDKFGAAVARGLEPSLRQPQQQLTQAQIEEKLGKPKMTVDLIRLLRDPETPPEKALEALEAYNNQQAAYLLKASGHAIDGRFQEVSPQIEALQRARVEQQQKEFVSNVVTRFPTLKGKGNAINQAIKAMGEAGYDTRGKSKSQVQRDVAQTAAKLLRQLDSNFTLKRKQGDQPNSTRPGSSGGHGGRSNNKSKSWMDTAFPAPRF